MEGPQAVYRITNSVSGDTGFELNLHRLSCVKTCTKVEQRTCTNLEDHVENNAQQASNCCSVIKKDNIIAEEVGVVETFHFQNSHEQFVGHYSTPEEDTLSNSKEISACKEFIPSNARLNKCLNKSATFPSSVESLNLFYAERNGISSAERNETSSSTTAPVQNSSSEDQFSTYKRSTSLPASSCWKLVSAMKGGRAEQGTSTSGRMDDMRVKWAVDVYDPPATSMSHTVKSYNIHRLKKKDNSSSSSSRKKKFQKNSRGRSSNSSSNSGKKSPSKYVHSAVPTYLASSSRLQAGGANGGGQDVIKCGSIFLWDSLANKHVHHDA